MMKKILKKIFSILGYVFMGLVLALVIYAIAMSASGKEISVLRCFDEITIGDTAVFTLIRDGKIVDVQIKKFDIIEQK